MEHITDWIMIIITAIYVVATIIVCIANLNSAKAAKEAVAESKKQFDQSIQLQKQHNYDTVRPAISIDFSSSDSEYGFSGSIIVTNHGLGPAVLKELKFKKNNKEYKNTNGYCTIYDLISFRLAEENEQMPIKAVFNPCQYYSKEFRNNDDNRDYLAVGEKLTLLKFTTKNGKEGELVGKLFHGVQIELVYTDLYNSCDWKVRNRLSYFKPNWIDNRNVKEQIQKE